MLATKSDSLSSGWDPWVERRRTPLISCALTSICTIVPVHEHTHIHTRLKILKVTFNRILTLHKTTPHKATNDKLGYLSLWVFKWVFLALPTLFFPSLVRCSFCQMNFQVLLPVVCRRTSLAFWLESHWTWEPVQGNFACSSPPADLFAYLAPSSAPALLPLVSVTQITCTSFHRFPPSTLYPSVL